MTKRKNVGQAMTEYIIIVVLCAIGLLLVVTFFGNDIKEMFYAASASVRGGKQQKVAFDSKQAGTSFEDADKEHDTSKLDQ